MRILIVEDSPVDSLLLRNIIARGGHDCWVAATGEEALQALEDHPEIGLVLADIFMPGMDGIQLLETMRTLPHLSNMPVMFVSGASEAETVQRAAALEPAGYMLKPYNEPSVIISRVAALEEKVTAVIQTGDVIQARWGLPASGVKTLFAKLEKVLGEVLEGEACPGRDTTDTLRGLAHSVGADRLLAALEHEDAEAWRHGGRINRELQALMNCVLADAA